MLSNLCSPSFSRLTTIRRPAPTLPRLLPTIALSLLAATVMDLPTSVVNKRVRLLLSSLDTTLTNHRRVGVLCPFLVAPPYRYVAPTYLLCLPLLGKLPAVYPKFPFWKGCTPNVQTFILQTFKRSNLQ